jgi:hypothetical protein
MAGRNSCHTLFQERKTECCFFRTVFYLFATVARYPEPVWLCNGDLSGNCPAAFFRFEMMKGEYDLWQFQLYNGTNTYGTDHGKI